MKIEEHGRCTKRGGKQGAKMRQALGVVRNLCVCSHISASQFIT